MLLWFLFRQTRNKQIANYVLRMYRYTITIIIEDWDKLSDLLDTLVPNLLLMLFINELLKVTKILSYNK